MSPDVPDTSRPRRLLAVLALGYVVFSVVSAGFFVWLDRADTLDEVFSDTRNVCRLLDEHANRTLDAAELVAARLGDRADELGLGPAQPRAAARQMVADMLTGSPYLGNFYLVDAKGTLRYDARGFGPVGQTMTGHDWVRSLLEGKADAVVGPVEFDNATRVYVFTLGRRVVDGGGVTKGVVGVTIPVDYFKQFYQQLDVGPVPALGVYRLDGEVLVRQPLKPEDVGRNMAANPIYTQHLPKAPSGTYRGRSAVDGVDRVVSYRTVPGRDLLVWVSVGVDEAMAGWRMRTAQIGLLTVAGGLVFLVLASMLWRELNREGRAAQALALANHDLQRSNDDLEQFAYIASHDLKEPLRNISSYVQLLRRRYQGKLDADADAFIGYAVDGVTRMQNIIGELLAYSRVGTGELRREPVQTGTLVSTALTHLKTVIAEVQAAVEVDGQLPVVDADGAMLGSLFQNLIANALKYRRDDARPEVTVGCRDQGGHWAFFVKDNGIGIDPEYHEQIFDLFKRLHPRDRFTGTGIGLAVCQRVVGRHGGRIWVESVPGQGSTFWFTLPKRSAAC